LALVTLPALIISVYAPSGIRVVATVTVGNGPLEIGFNPSNSETYVGNLGNDSVSVISNSNTLLTTIYPLVPNYITSPRALTFDPVNNDTYVALSTQSSVKAISPSTNTVVATVSTGGNPRSILYDPTNHELYVAALGEVTVINATTNQFIQNIDIAGEPEYMAYNPVNNDIYVTNTGPNSCSGCSGADQVSVISGATNTVVATVTVGNQAIWATFDPTNNDTYVTNAGGSSVSVISSSNSVVATVTVGSSPYMVLYDPANHDIFVTNHGGSSVSVINSANSATFHHPYGS